MSNADVLMKRERDGTLIRSVSVGLDILGMPLNFSSMTEADVEEWMRWHDKWEAMDRGTQDSYLVLLALKGD